VQAKDEDAAFGLNGETMRLLKTGTWACIAFLIILEVCNSVFFPGHPVAVASVVVATRLNSLVAHSLCMSLVCCYQP
jgi:hypothetical protein